MKKLALALVLVLVALFAVGCGGGLSNNFGVSKNNITKIEYRYGSGSSYKTIALSKAGDLMKTFDVEYVSCERNFEKSNSQFVIHYNLDGTDYKVFLFVQLDKTVVAERYDGYATYYYKTTEAVEVPLDLTR
jgi:hypothetical protein